MSLGRGRCRGGSYALLQALCAVAIVSALVDGVFAVLLSPYAR